jgi:hypothetical protein
MRCTLPLCMSLLCSSMLCIAPPLSSVAGPALRSGRSTAAHTANSRTPSRALSRHSLGAAHIPAAPAPALAHSRVLPGAAGVLFHPRTCLLRPPFPLWRRSPVHVAPIHTRTARASSSPCRPPFRAHAGHPCLCAAPGAFAAHLLPYCHSPSCALLGPASPRACARAPTAHACSAPARHRSRAEPLSRSAQASRARTRQHARQAAPPAALRHQRRPHAAAHARCLASRAAHRA